MIITTNLLNDLETAITTPQIEGIEFISMTENGINSSYSNILSILNNHKLPILKYQDNNSSGYIFINRLFIDKNDIYYCYTSNDRFEASDD